ncbi:MAG TPA: hypothetical protein VNP96_11885 [Solirubrobacterales bacterium]|nr:hypothetical protein [Solirubrobacterales bacterium]
MSRLSLIVLGVLACAALVAAPAAVAAPTTETCTAASPQVVGGKVTAKLASSNVDPLQAQFATCGHAKRVMKKVTQLGLEQPRGDVAGFYCRPTVFSTEPDFVLYVCTFRGADTATFIKSTFAVQYKS